MENLTTQVLPLPSSAFKKTNAVLLEQQNEDFTKSGHLIRKFVTEDEELDYRQSTHIRYIETDMYGDPRPCMVSTLNMKPTHPLV